MSDIFKPVSREEKLLDRIAEAAENISSASLPHVSSTDNGKILKVTNGEWAKGDAPNELPSVTTADEGKTLTVDDTGVWAAENSMVVHSIIDYPAVLNKFTELFTNVITAATASILTDSVKTVPIAQTIFQTIGNSEEQDDLIDDILANIIKGKTVYINMGSFGVFEVNNYFAGVTTVFVSMMFTGAVNATEGTGLTGRIISIGRVEFRKSSDEQEARIEYSGIVGNDPNA